METRLAAMLAAGALTVGIALGAAGMVIARDAQWKGMGMSDMTATHGMAAIHGMASMQGHMGAGMPMSPSDHAAHHDSLTP